MLRKEPSRSASESGFRGGAPCQGDEQPGSREAESKNDFLWPIGSAWATPCSSLLGDLTTWAPPLWGLGASGSSESSAEGFLPGDPVGEKENVCPEERSLCCSLKLVSRGQPAVPL